MNDKIKHAFHMLINPILMAGMAWLIIDKLNSMQRQIDLIAGIKEIQAVQSLRIDLTTSAITDLRNDFKEHVKLYAQKEDEIEFPKPQKHK